MDVEAWHQEDKFKDKEKAQKIFDKIKNEKKEKVVDIQKSDFKQAPPFPFDLTTLQTEAYRCFKIQPKDTLDIAQSLYLA